MKHEITTLAAEILDLSEQASDSVETTGGYDSHFELINSLDERSVSMSYLLINEGLFLDKANRIIQLSSDAEMSIEETDGYDTNFDLLTTLESEAVSLAYAVLS